MLIEQISVFIENVQGRLSSITKALSDGGIDIRALSLADTSSYGILRLIVGSPEKAKECLKAAGFTVTVTSVIAVEVPDKPGGLYTVLEALGEAGIGVEYAYAFITRKSDGAFVILRVENNDAATAVLLKNGIKLMNPDELYSI